MAGLYFALMCWSLKPHHVQIIKGLLFGTTMPWSSRTCRTTEITAFAENKMFMNMKLQLGCQRVFRLWSCKSLCLGFRFGLFFFSLCNTYWLFLIKHMYINADPVKNIYQIISWNNIFYTTQPAFKHVFCIQFDLYAHIISPAFLIEPQLIYFFLFLLSIVTYLN